MAQSPVVSVPSGFPSEAAAPTSQGASAFARYWFDQLNLAAQTGETESLLALGTPACVACQRFAESIGNIYGAGGRIEGGRFTVVAAEAPLLKVDQQTARVTVIYGVSPTRQIDAAGQVMRSVGALSKLDGEMMLARSGPSWLVTSLVVNS